MRAGCRNNELWRSRGEELEDGCLCVFLSAVLVPTIARVRVRVRGVLCVCVCACWVVLGVGGVFVCCVVVVVVVHYI